MYRSKEITTRLKISPATLRLWTSAFASLLSPGASGSQTESGTAGWRSFTEDDLAILTKAKSLLTNDRTYDQVLAILTSGESIDPPSEPPPDPSLDAPTSPQTPAIIEQAHPIIKAFEEALRAKDETIESLQTRVVEITASKDETIAALNARIEELKVQPPAVVPEVHFRWGWLKRLLTGGAQDVG